MRKYPNLCKPIQIGMVTFRNRMWSAPMGGTDITSTAYNSGTGAISITSVTGNIVITATAVEE